MGNVIILALTNSCGLYTLSVVIESRNDRSAMLGSWLSNELYTR